MLVIQRARWRRRILCSLILFVLVVGVFASAVDTLWFREDDLGTIINGLMDSWRSFFRVLFSDCRSFITPCNYQRTVPNVVSGFLRPVQHIFLSLVYAIWGVDPLPYYYANVLCHAANAALLVVASSIWLPLTLAWSIGFIFAFYPDMTWLVWVTTLQNSLATFFLLLTVLACCAYVWASTPLRRIWWWWASGFFFLCSLLSRETGIFLPVWFFMGAYLFATTTALPWWQRTKLAAMHASIFFLTTAVYFLMRLCAFGVHTLPRTIHNLTLRYPCLQSCGHHDQVIAAVARRVQAVARSVQQGDIVASLWDMLYDRCCIWLSVAANVALKTVWHKWLAVCIAGVLIIFLVRAFKGHGAILGWLMVGLGCTLWPGFLAYPNQRYLNLMYPFIIFIIIYGVYAAHKYSDSVWMRFVSLIIFMSMWGMGIRGIYANMCGLKSAAHGCFTYKQRFEDFFARYHFDSATNFVIVSTPFVSDIQSVFQAFLNNRTTRVVCDPFATIAQQGIMGCRKDYRIAGVPSTMVFIPGGVRLISQDPQHCGWWLRFSDFPIAWSEEERAYAWTDEPYHEGIWYRCSIGKFMINQQIDENCAADISFVFDSRWVDDKTIFVAWDTIEGRYVVCSPSRGSYIKLK
jgi:hypothetical protein